MVGEKYEIVARGRNYPHNPRCFDLESLLLPPSLTGVEGEEMGCEECLFNSYHSLADIEITT